MTLLFSLLGIAFSLIPIFAGFAASVAQKYLKAHVVTCRNIRHPGIKQGCNLPREHFFSGGPVMLNSFSFFFSEKIFQQVDIVVVVLFPSHFPP